MLLRQKPNDNELLIKVNNKTHKRLNKYSFFPKYMWDKEFYYVRNPELMRLLKDKNINYYEGGESNQK